MTTITRLRGVMLVAAMTLGAGPLAAQDDAPETPSDDMVVTLLGTGTPTLNVSRFGPSNLVQAGGLNLLFDAGRGASIRLAQLGETPGTMDAVFLSHLHSDHINGLGDIYASGYIVGATMKGRSDPFEIYGPPGTQKLMEGLQGAFDWDAQTRITDENVPEAATRIDAQEVEEGVIFDRDGVTVTVFPVDHGDNISHALGYRVDYAGKSVLFSGDTTYDETIAEMGAGVDLLIHENGLATAELMQRDTIRKIMAHHTSPEDVGRILDQARPGMAVYSHMVLLGNPSMSEVIERTRTTYDGPLVIGQDLMRFVLSDDGPAMRVIDQ